MSDSDEESDSDSGSNYEVESGNSDEEKGRELYTIDQRKKIVDYWWNNGKKRTFKSVQNKYRKLTCENTLRQWKTRLEKRIGTYALVIIWYFLN